MKKETRRTFRELAYYSSLGFQVALSIVIGLAVGLYFDKKFETHPLLLFVGLGLGIAATAGVGAVIALIWAGVGIALGRSFEGRDAAESTPATQEA